MAVKSYQTTHRTRSEQAATPGVWRTHDDEV